MRPHFNADSTHIQQGLLAFELARAKGKMLLERCIQRLVAELQFAKLLQPHIEQSQLLQSATQISVDNQGWDPPPLGMLSWLRLMRRQKKLLKERLAAVDITAAIVSLSTRRLPFPRTVSVRENLSLLTRALPGMADAEYISRAIGACDCILVFEPHASFFWERAESLWAERVYIIDYRYLTYLFLMAPFCMFRALWGNRSVLVKDVFRLAFHKTRVALAAIFFSSTYRKVLQSVASPKAFFLTSNSFATEILRNTLLHNDQPAQIIELTHGVPTTEFNEYLATLLSYAAPLSKHHLVPQIPGLPLVGAMAGLSQEWAMRAINTGMNHYFMEKNRQNQEITRWLDHECEVLLKACNARHPVVISFMGASAHDANYLASSVFAIERTLINQIVRIMNSFARPYTVVYTPHPLNRKYDFMPFFEQKIVVYPNTMFMWMIADAAVALYSTALFEAAFAGARVFTPLRHIDDIFSPALLDTLHHPTEGEDINAALAAYLSCLEPDSSEELYVRAVRRMSCLNAYHRSVQIN